LVPAGFPWQQPERFYTDKDIRLEGGVHPQNTADAEYFGGPLVRGLLWWHWRVCHPSTDVSLTQYVLAMWGRFRIKR
jgi:hypothetical protein